MAATAWLLAALPLAGIGVGYIGADQLRILLHAATGAGCALLALALQVAGLAWSRRLTASMGGRRGAGRRPRPRHGHGHGRPRSRWRWRQARPSGSDGQARATRAVAALGRRAAGGRRHCGRSRWAGGRRPRQDGGMNTAEYAVGTLAAAAFAGIPLKVLTSDRVRAALTALVERVAPAPTPSTASTSCCSSCGVAVRRRYRSGGTYGERGSATVEFAVGLPALVLLLLFRTRSGACRDRADGVRRRRWGRGTGRGAGWRQYRSGSRPGTGRRDRVRPSGRAAGTGVGGG